MSSRNRRRHGFSHAAFIALLFATTAVAQQIPSGSAEEAVRTVKDRLGVRTCEVHPLRATAKSAGRLELDVSIEGHRHRLTLRPHSIRAPGFRVRVQTADGSFHDAPVPTVTTYRGTVDGAEGERVLASIVDGKVNAEVTPPDSKRMWIVQPLGQFLPGSASEDHVIYPADEVVSVEGRCAVESADTNAQMFAGEDASAAAASLNAWICQIACDADVEYYTLNGSSVANTVADIEGVLNAMSPIWERDVRIRFAISQVLVRTAEPDPYSTTNPYALLEAFRKDWRDNHGDIVRDVAQMFTGRTMSGCIGIGDSSGSFCTNYYGHSIVQSRYTTDYAKRVAISAHELGHNFSASHCDYGDLWCRLMCSSIGGCSAAIHSFEPASVASIRNFASTLACLEPAAIDITSLALPFSETFSGNGDLDPARWVAVDNANRYYNLGQIWCSRSYNGTYQEFGTMRTQPISVHRPVRVSYRTRPSTSTQPGTHALKVEYLESGSYQWRLIESVPVIVTSTWTAHEFVLPASCFGDSFALRFSGYGVGVYGGYSWYLDDVGVAAVPIPGDCNNDGDVDGDDFQCFAACLSGPDIPRAATAACQAVDFDGDGDVDQGDFGVFQRCFSGSGKSGDPSCATGV